MTLTEYIQGQIARLIDGVAEQARRAETDTSEDGVHDLRVAIRRLNESLKVFKGLFPAGTANLVRNDLRAAMKNAGEVRNCDIAAKLRLHAKLKPDAGYVPRRDRAAERLRMTLNGWNTGPAIRAWREQLHV